MIFVIALIAVMAAVSVYAWYTVAPNVEKVPMHWSLSGKANRLAPRWIAFGFIPVLAAAVMILMAASRAVGTTHIALSGGIFLACQLLHIALTRRWFTATRR
jgi:uncharacterized membrane protein